MAKTDALICANAEAKRDTNYRSAIQIERKVSLLDGLSPVFSIAAPIDANRGCLSVLVLSKLRDGRGTNAEAN
jgi:hypothetical protein